MARIVIVSFRLGGTDGVAIESAKWTGALATLGHSVRTVAGEGIADVQIPGLAINATTSTSIQALETALADADLVIVENLASLPLNLDARDVLYHVLEGRSFITTTCRGNVRTSPTWKVRERAGTGTTSRSTNCLD